MLIDKYINTISPYSIIRRNNDRTTTYSTSPPLYTERLALQLCFFFISVFIIIIITGFYFYIELPTKCKDLVSGIGFHLILAYFLYSLHVNSYFPAFKQVQQYIYTDWQGQEPARSGVWKGHMLVRWAQEQTAAGPAGSATPAPYPARGGTRRLAPARGSCAHGRVRVSSPAETRAAAGPVGSAPRPAPPLPSEVGLLLRPPASWGLQQCRREEEDEGGNRNKPWAGAGDCWMRQEGSLASSPRDRQNSRNQR